MSADLVFATVAELGRAIRSGAVSPTELALRSLERLDTVGRSLNAVATLTPERALAAARKAEDELAAGVDRGPLHGIPYGAKDLLATVDYPTSWGAEPFRDRQSERDAEVVRLLDESGAVLCASFSWSRSRAGLAMNSRTRPSTGPVSAPGDPIHGQVARPAGRGRRSGRAASPLPLAPRRGDRSSAHRRSMGSQGCGRAMERSAATARWRSRGRWTRLARCAAPSRTANWC